MDLDFLKDIDRRLAVRDMTMIRSECNIDFKHPQAMLLTNFSSYHEPGEDQENTNVLSFEIKPKSGVTEYVPKIVKDYIQANRDKLDHFFNA